MPLKVGCSDLPVCSEEVCSCPPLSHAYLCPNPSPQLQQNAMTCQYRAAFTQSWDCTGWKDFSMTDRLPFKNGTRIK